MQKHFCKKVNLLLLFVLTLSLLTLEGCHQKGDSASEEIAPVNAENEMMETFNIINMEEKIHKIILSTKKMTVYDLEQPVVIVHIFDTLDTQSRYQLRAFSKLQQTYPNDLFVISLLVGDAVSTKMLTDTIASQKLNHYISNDIENQHIQELLYKSLSIKDTSPLPLSILYTDGEYTIHYEGATPIEMLDYNIKQAIKG